MTNLVWGKAESWSYQGYLYSQSDNASSCPFVGDNLFQPTIPGESANFEKTLYIPLHVISLCSISDLYLTTVPTELVCRCAKRVCSPCLLLPAQLLLTGLSTPPPTSVNPVPIAAAGVISALLSVWVWSYMPEPCPSACRCQVGFCHNIVHMLKQ